MSHLLSESDRYERQIRAFGPELQTSLAQVTIAVIGLGGIGSLVTQALTHLGARTLILVDPETVTTSNLNRLACAGPADTGEPKVDIARRAALAVQPSATVTTLHGSVTDPQTWSRLRPADVIIGAVDAHAPRWALNRLAIQYARYYIDTGVDLRRGPDGVEAGGHVAVVRPTGPCLLCLSGYDPAAVGTELDPHLTNARRTAGYRVDDPTAPTPSVIFLNQVLAGHTTAAVVDLLRPWRAPPLYLLANLTTATTTALHGERNPTCPACGPNSPRAHGDAAEPPTFTIPATPPPAR